ncbi:isochorismate synthase [Rhodococcus sp. 14-2483-1-2]|uniref:isochorismate synthase n=1 Tax=Rhodococcus sp. 14-2483-1-2 TaxID=2023147 RepID=UPI00207B1AE4|nr:isochorismate synthase [Rhodococcus sp. 14-2483-1-2]
MLSRPHGTVSISQSLAQYRDVTAASSALRSNDVGIVAGALPFARGEACALYGASDWSSSPAIWSPNQGANALPHFDVSVSDAGAHVDRVRAAVNVLRDGNSALQKVVLARTLELVARGSVDPVSILAALVAGNPSGNGFHVDLSAAGGSYAGRALVGSSPEVLILREGRTISCHPLAGSAPRYADPDQDRRRGRELAESAKDLREHAFVVDAIRDTLAPLCTELDVPSGPTLTTTPQLWHLGTPVRGTLRSLDTTALDLVLALHPTPAVCGTPTDLAYEIIDELEGERGFYAGAVGWCTADGDGEWMVSIRCIEIGQSRRTITAYAGGGIVAESDPDAELRETITKFGTVMTALGVRS